MPRTLEFYKASFAFQLAVLEGFLKQICFKSEHLGHICFSGSSTLAMLTIFPSNLMLENVASSIIMILYGG